MSLFPSIARQPALVCLRLRNVAVRLLKNKYWDQLDRPKAVYKHGQNPMIDTNKSLLIFMERVDTNNSNTHINTNAHAQFSTFTFLDVVTDDGKTLKKPKRRKKTVYDSFPILRNRLRKSHKVMTLFFFCVEFSKNANKL